MSIDDTEELEEYRGFLRCVPEKWGYSVEEGEAQFPKEIYPK
ncbi:MAG: hypothetical protein V2I33_24130 [Kangiellaceae bacterium]|nr:hypothetical protein [Kangiellaceae bacterium]